MIYAALTQFKIRCNLFIFFRQICTPKVSEFTKIKVLCQSGPGKINDRYDYGRRSIICLIFSFTPSITFSINLSYYSLYQKKSLTTKNLHNFHKKMHIKWILRDPFLPVLQAPHKFTDYSFSYCVSHVTCHLSGVSIFLEGLVSMQLSPSFSFFILFDWSLISLRLYVYFHFLVSAEFQIIWDNKNISCAKIVEWKYIVIDNLMACWLI